MIQTQDVIYVALCERSLALDEDKVQVGPHDHFNVLSCTLLAARTKHFIGLLYTQHFTGLSRKDSDSGIKIERAQLVRWPQLSRLSLV